MRFGRFDRQLKHNQFMSLPLISKTFSDSQWYQILHWLQQILFIFVSFELILNFSSSTFWQVALNYNGLVASNLVTTNLLKKKLRLIDTFSQNALFFLTIWINESFVVQTIKYPWFDWESCICEITCV